MTLTGPDARILQIHPTRFCNLRCVHCYSSSGPMERDALGVPLLQRAIGDAAGLGYNVLSVSGGEPMLYPGLASLCREGRDQGMTVTLVTNGTALTEKRIADLAGAVDAIAISIDGMPDRHNRIRRSPGAFRSMESRLKLVRNWGIPFWFVFTLTRENLAELEWAADFAVAQGARLFQIHPLEESGRALSAWGMACLTEEDRATAWLVAECLRDIHLGKLNVQFDCLNRYALPVGASDVASWKNRLDEGLLRISDIVSPLVVEDDGATVPLRYGFPRSLAFGNLRAQRLNLMAAEWVRRRAGAFFDVYRQVLNQIVQSPNRFANIYQLLADEAAYRAPDLVSIG